MTPDAIVSEGPLPAGLGEHLAPSEAAAPATLVSLVEWARPRDPEDSEGAASRLRELAVVLAARPALRERVRSELAGLLTSARGIPLLAEAGILSTQGFLGEIVARLYERVLPAPAHPGDLRAAFARIFHDADDAQWVPAVPPPCWIELIRVLGLEGGPEADELVRRAVDVVEVLALRIAAEGTQEELLHIDPDAARHDSPFLALQREVADFLREGETGSADHVRVLLAQCLESVARLRSIGRRRGTSVRVTYLLERMEQHLRRLGLVLRYVAPLEGSSREQAAYELFCTLAEASALRHSVTEVWHSNVRMIAKRVTENASRTGEHYVAQDRREYFSMMRAAMGAGVLIALMALLKIGVKDMRLAPLVETLLVCADYAVGFVIIHILHFTVATKQPAMTAAMIAASVEEAQSRKRAPLDNLAATFASVTRTQLIAIIGNIALALPLAMAIASAYGSFHAQPMLSQPKAAELLLELRPVAGFALLHAAIAGVWLFVVGLVSGWYDNRCAVLDIPERLRGSPLVRWMPASWRDRLAEYVDGNLGALMGNAIFGILLGATGFVGFVLGLPIDIRHVAFASANLGYAAISQDLAPAGFFLTLVFVLMIGAMNLLVSFSLALYVALRARGVAFDRVGELIAAVWRLLRTDPKAFFLPPSATPPAAG
jgi:site-specific recombinase